MPTLLILSVAVDIGTSKCSVSPGGGRTGLICASHVGYDSPCVRRGSIGEFGRATSYLADFLGRKATLKAPSCNSRRLLLATNPTQLSQFLGCAGFSRLLPGLILQPRDFQPTSGTIGFGFLLREALRRPTMSF